MEGLYRVDEAALNALPDETLLTLRKTGALPLAYAQALLDEAVTLFFNGEPDTSKLILRDLVNATCCC